MDDFGIKCIGKQHANHLLNAIHQKCQLTCDWDGSLFCGISLKWDHTNGTVNLSMPGYVERAPHKFQHPTPHRPEHLSHAWNEPIYSKNTQQVAPANTSQMTAN
jgi:endonuclease I